MHVPLSVEDAPCAQQPLPDGSPSSSSWNTWKNVSMRRYLIVALALNVNVQRRRCRRTANPKVSIPARVPSPLTFNTELNGVSSRGRRAGGRRGTTPSKNTQNTKTAAEKEILESLSQVMIHVYRSGCRDTERDRENEQRTERGDTKLDQQQQQQQQQQKQRVRVKYGKR